MEPYYNLCINDTQLVIERARTVLGGKIEVFGKYFNFDFEKDWLRDPVSRNLWDKDVLFSQALYNQKGCSDVKYVLEVNKMNHLVDLAHAYHCTKNEKYIDDLEKQITGWLKCVRNGKSVVNRIMMELAYRAINLVQTSLLCSDNARFIKDIHPLIVKVLIAYESSIRRFSTPRWYKTGNGDNHVTGEMVGLIITQIWLSHFTSNTYTKYYKQEVKYLINILSETIDTSGVYLEQSANYTRVVTEFLIIFDLITKNLHLHRKTFEKYESYNFLEKLLNYLKDISYNDTLPNFGDNDNARILLPFINDFNSINYVTSYIAKIDPRNERVNFKEYINGSQWIYHSKDNNEVYLFTRVGKLSYMKEGAGTHAHNDLLSVILFVKGSPVFIDKGCGFYNMGNQVRKESISTLGHNTIVVDDIEMAEPLFPGYKDYPLSSCIKNDKSNSDCHFVGYLKYKGIEHQREIKYKQPSVTIIDKISSINKNLKTVKISFLLGEQLVIIEKKKTSCKLQDNNNGNCFELLFSGISELTITKEKYYPRYGEEFNTFRLSGNSISKNSKEHNFTTIIKFY